MPPANLHGMNAGTAQLAIVDVLRRIFGLYCVAPPREVRDLRIIVGRGLRSPMPRQPIVRDSALRFLQVIWQLLDGACRTRPRLEGIQAEVVDSSAPLGLDCMASPREVRDLRIVAGRRLRSPTPRQPP